VDAAPAEVLAVGRVRRPHGIHGEVLADVITDFPERVVAGGEIGLGASAPERWLRIERVRLHKGCFLLTFAGVTSRDEVEPWRGSWLFLPAQERSALPPRYYYEHELLGMTCVLGDGAVVGEVAELTFGTGPAQLTVRTAAGDVLVPFTSPIVVRVDLPQRTIVLDPPRGLLDGDAL
jgi:16S rRNA processing protein RimM